jgi:hypothetical protein
LKQTFGFGFWWSQRKKGAKKKKNNNFWFTSSKCEITKSASSIERQPAPPEHAESDDRVGGAAHRGVTGYVPSAQSSSNHFGGNES